MPSAMMTRTELEPDPVVRLLTQTALAGVMVFGSAFAFTQKSRGAFLILRERNEIFHFIGTVVRDEPDRQIEVTVGCERPKVDNPSPGFRSPPDHLKPFSRSIR